MADKKMIALLAILQFSLGFAVCVGNNKLTLAESIPSEEMSSYI